MCCNEFQRIFELRDFAISLNSADTYFQRNDTKFSDPRKRKFFLDIERDLQGLDSEAWKFLKGEAFPRLSAKHPARGWQQLFETLNEAKGYNYLVSIGCRAVKFIPRSKIKNVKTPDLQAYLASEKLLCEVKTISASENEAERRKAGGVGETFKALNDGFLNKLIADVRAAETQMLKYDAQPEIRRIAFIVVNFDDNLHEYADEYHRQIDSHIASVLTSDVQVVLDIKPPFYSAR